MLRVSIIGTIIDPDLARFEAAMIHVLKGKRFRFWPHVFVFAAYTLLAIWPQTLEAAWVGSVNNRLAWWPLALAVAIMIVCMLTDAFHRPVIERVAFVVLGIVL